MIGSDDASRPALLIAAHGERTAAASNDGAFRIARSLSGRGLVSEVAVGFIKGVPSIRDELDRLAARRVIVYPLFVSNGYFTRDRLVQLLDEASDRSRRIQVLPPLGLDPGLPDLAVVFAEQAAREYGMVPQGCAVIFLAHGSRRNSASRKATEQLARAVDQRGRFREVRVAFLEEKPFLAQAAVSISGPAVVVGLFSGEGVHGAADAPRLTAELMRAEIAFAGVIGRAAGIEDLVARSVREAVLRNGHLDLFAHP